MASFETFLREPLVHFFIIGAGVFVLYDQGSGPQSTTSHETRIVVDEADIRRLEASFERVWQRQPDRVERAGLIDAHVREEILNREALRLGLANGDEVIRKRLAQKMDYLLSAERTVDDPADPELRSYLEANAERYRRPAAFSFVQVFLGETTEAADVARTLQALQAGANPDALTKSSLIPAQFGGISAAGVRSIFGASFAAAMPELEEGVWTGPVPSGYGVHLVRLDLHTPGGPPDFSAIRPKLLADWRRGQLDLRKQQAYQSLAAAYTVERPPHE